MVWCRMNNIYKNGKIICAYTEKECNLKLWPLLESFSEKFREI